MERFLVLRRQRRKGEGDREILDTSRHRLASPRLEPSTPSGSGSAPGPPSRPRHRGSYCTLNAAVMCPCPVLHCKPAASDQRGRSHPRNPVLIHRAYDHPRFVRRLRSLTLLCLPVRGKPVPHPSQRQSQSIRKSCFAFVARWAPAAFPIVTEASSWRVARQGH